MEPHSDRVFSDATGDSDANGGTGMEAQPRDLDTDDCLQMMWPPDGYEVRGEELEDFVVMIRINCPGVSAALHVDWSEVDPAQPGAGDEAGGKSARAPSASWSNSSMRIPVDEPSEGMEPDESLEIKVYLKRGSKLWRWTDLREDGSSTTKEYRILILPLFEPSLSVSFPPPDFEFRAAVRPFFVGKKTASVPAGWHARAHTSLSHTHTHTPAPST